MSFWSKTLALLLALLLVGVVIWCWVAAPCSVYEFSHTKDIPGRCVMHQ